MVDSSNPFARYMWRFTFLVSVGLFLAACGDQDNSVGHDEINYFDGSGIRNMAHRGGSGLAPENTVVAFETGLAAGATIIETDVHTSSDGVLILIHDDTVDRTTDGHGLVHEMGLKEIKALDAAYWFTADGGMTYPYRGKGIRIPTLKEAFDRFPRGRFNIEIKQTDPPLEQALLDLVHSEGMERQVLIASMDDLSIEKVRQIDPTIPTNAGISETTRFIRWYPNIPPEDPVLARAFQIPQWVPLLFPRIIPNAKEAGIEVHLWTIDERRDMEIAILVGVDGIITNYPDILAELLDNTPK